MGQADRVECRDDAAPDEQHRRGDVPVGRKPRQRQHAGEPDRRAGEQQDAAVADAVAEIAERDLQQNVAEADHRQQQGCVGFGIADAVAVDREQGEAAGLDRADRPCTAAVAVGTSQM